MKLLFIILAHDQPEQLLELAATLAEAASDGRVIIHFDAGAKGEDYEKLRESLSGKQRITLMERRVRCPWGGYGLVEAVLLALAEARAQGEEYDYALLLSGSCLPCRPIRQLERYLAENSGLEFIETEGPEWVGGGIREERYTLYAVFPPLRYKRLEDFLFKMQRRFRIKRSLPAGIKTSKFGSQWWGLTWQTCLDILDFMAKNPAIERFYRKTWIPDEMLFPTMVTHLVAGEKIAGHSLTHYQFSDKGKPIVFYDDHEDYPFGLEKFFYRKVSEEAKALRRRSLALAIGPDKGEALEMIGRANQDYAAKVKAQTHFPAPGQLYYKDQQADAKATLLKRLKKPYVIVCGSLEPGSAILPSWDHVTLNVLSLRPARPHTPLKRMAEPYVVLCDSQEAVEATLAVLNLSAFELLGQIFKPEVVDFGQGRESFHGLKNSDAAIRDMAPALYFSRIIKRCEKIPVFLWMPGDNWALIDIAIADPRCRLREIRLW